MLDRLGSRQVAGKLILAVNPWKGDRRLSLPTPLWIEPLWSFPRRRLIVTRLSELPRVAEAASDRAQPCADVRALGLASATCGVRGRFTSPTIGAIAVISCMSWTAT